MTIGKLGGLWVRNTSRITWGSETDQNSSLINRSPMKQMASKNVYSKLFRIQFGVAIYQRRMRKVVLLICVHLVETTGGCSPILVFPHISDPDNLIMHTICTLYVRSM